MKKMFNEMNKDKKVCEYRKKGKCTAIESVSYDELCTPTVHRSCFHPDAEGCC